jgi:hypothetical protein
MLHCGVKTLSTTQRLLAPRLFLRSEQASQAKSTRHLFRSYNPELYVDYVWERAFPLSVISLQAQLSMWFWTRMFATSIRPTYVIAREGCV